MVLLQIIVFVLFGTIAFSDGVVRLIAPSVLRATTIQADVQDPGIFASFMDERMTLCEEQCDITVVQTEQGYEVNAPDLAPQGQVQLETLLQKYHLHLLMNQLETDTQAMIVQILEPEIVYLTQAETQSSTNRAFVMVSGIYFLMLTFSSMVANEVVVEKTSNFIELVSASASTKVHFYAKFLSGWLLILIQCMGVVFMAGFWIFVRFLYDRLAGLYELVWRLHLSAKRWTSIRELLTGLGVDLSDWPQMMLSFLFVMAGIVLVQALMTLLSARVQAAEEAGSIQGPFYVVLLLTYYLTLWCVQSVHPLAARIKYVGSFVPFFSMLLMPARLLSIHVPIMEVMLSFMFALGTLITLFIVGPILYRRAIFAVGRKGA